MARFACLLLLILLPGCQSQREAPLVFAAASTVDYIEAAAALFERESGQKIRLNFAGSSTLARQIDQGAPAGLYISANPAWMDFLEERGLIERKSRRVLCRNQLVLVSRKPPSGSFDWSKPLVVEGRLALADPAHVPAGIYARQALEHLGQWDHLADQLAPAADVRAASRLVVLGEAELGLIYASDVRSEDPLYIWAKVPDESHAPIAYHLALLPGAPDSIRSFERFLSSGRGQTLLLAHGFLPP